MMASYILIAVIVVCLLSVYISVSAGLQNAMDRLTRFFLAYLAIHATHAWAVRVYFPDNMRLDYLAPYGLLYGPFLYAAYQIGVGAPLTWRRMVPHVLPFLFFLLCYFLWLAFPSLFSGKVKALALAFYGTLSVSFAGYALWALFFTQGSGKTEGNKDVRMISVMAMVLAFIAALFVVFVYSGILSGDLGSQFEGSVVFLTMLSAAVMLFSGIIRKIVRRPAGSGGRPAKPTEGRTGEEVEAGTPKDNGPYQKSAISAAVLDRYEQQLRAAVEDQKAYLDEGLSLAVLARRLKIPKHHLSQVFSQRVGKNFNIYINEQRIKHAVSLMHTEREMNISEIFLKSGFTAKASFNRYFKQFEGCTPSEYRNRINGRITQ